MAEKQIQKFAGRIVEHQNLFGELSTEDLQWAIQNPQKAIALMCKAIAEREKQEKDLLVLLGTALVPPTDGFVVCDKFVVDISDKVNVRIAWLGSNFKERFFEKIEEPTEESQLCYHKLLEQSLDLPIIASLGGEDKAETTLAQVFSLMEKQGGGEAGVLLINGSANIFYVRDVNGVLRAVYVDLHGDGWRVYARSVESPHRWYVDDQVFSSNS